MWKSKILIGVAGSVSAYKMADVVSQLVKMGHEVRVMTTEASLKFVGASTWEGLTGRAPLTSSFEEGQQMSHISWQRWADLILYAPVTAHTMNSMAAGLGGSPLLDLYLAHDFKKPFLLAPAMNTKMWTHPATVSSYRLLSRQGLNFIEPESGTLACGEMGDGRLSSPQNILSRVVQNLPRPSDSKRILITYGGTREPMDDVRAITNFSTGRSGARLAELLALQGHQVEVFRAESAPPALYSATEKIFSTSSSLDQLLTERLRTPLDIWIQMAAVSDFVLESIATPAGVRTNIHEPGKISSQHDSLTLNLKRTQKLIQTHGRLRSPHCSLVAFKLTSHAKPSEADAAVKALGEATPVDLVIHNDLKDHQAGRPVYTIYSRRGEVRHRLNGVEDLARQLPREATQALRPSALKMEGPHDLMP